MKLRQMRAVLLALVLVGLGAVTAHAQLEANLGALSDENARGYAGPLPKALSGTLNTAIFRSGYVARSQPTVQIEVHAMTVSFDDADKIYSPSDPPGFQSTEDVDAPTIIGSTEAVEQNGQAGTVLYHPGGFELDNFSLAVPQLTVGAYMGTKATVRWISLDLGDADLGDLSLVGFGVQHSITQYFGDLPPVDVAVGGFYQTFSIGNDLVDTKAMHFNVTGSKKYGVLQPYLGIGLDTFDMDLNYDSDLDNADADIQVDFDRETNAHFTIGLQLDLTNVTAHAEFNAAAETGFAVGIGFGL